MSEVLVQFDEPQRAADGREFVAQVCGQRMPEGLWEAWLQFSPVDGSDPVWTGRLTEQLSRGDLRFWAAGLTRAFLESSLVRALSPQNNGIYSGYAAAYHEMEPEHPEPAGEFLVADIPYTPKSRPVFDPFVVYLRGVHVLRQELRGLDAPSLRAIMVAYDIPDADMVGRARTFEDALVEQIVAGVQQRVGASRLMGRDGGRPALAD